MSLTTKYVGLDVSKQKIAIAIADEGKQDPRYWGSIPHTKEAVRKWVQQVRSTDMTLEVCYEAGPTGYVLYRWLLEMDVSCTVIAPSLIPKRAGDRIKTDKRDALRLAQLFRSGELTSIYIPTLKDESLRDLVRAREDAKEDLNRHKQRLGKLLLRHQLSPPNGATPWTHAYEEWLDTLQFTEDSQRVVFQEYRETIRETKERMKRYEKEIEEQEKVSHQAPLIQAFQALRGVAVLTATTLASEICTISRFPSASAFMSYCGLVPSERSSGETRWQGRLTKAGNAHLRRVLVESAWSYRYSPAVKRKMRERVTGLPSEIQTIAWNAQQRLHRKYRSMIRKGKHKGTLVAALARELAGFVWAIAKEVERLEQKKAA
ncbi:IS110 family transposase [Paenibacillus sp. PAMC21692]|uniref:IS110 family transposase n=1 Tax=Paenibacillus sp. PAMC21692 TaxID=2762320 RepID=UPI00164E1258|nr:IS110 family transposase [Paenibacillus sp. PAMC21692]QNK58711.1 IS110 family transposase [Paenibacillus sp. PAMC21692]